MQYTRTHVFCSSCGTKYQENALFCAVCGTQKKEPEIVQQVDSQTPEAQIPQQVQQAQVQQAPQQTQVQQDIPLQTQQAPQQIQNDPNSPIQRRVISKDEVFAPQESTEYDIGETPKATLGYIMIGIGVIGFIIMTIWTGIIGYYVRDTGIVIALYALVFIIGGVGGKLISKKKKDK
jgi:uncharacterized membrane protein